MGILTKAFSFTLWVAAATVVLPCVWVANVVYPKWTEWGEGF